MTDKWRVVVTAIFLPLFLASSSCSSAGPNVTPTNPARAAGQVSGSGIQSNIWNLKYVHSNALTDEFTLLGHVPFARSIEKSTGNKVKITLYGLESGVNSDKILDDVKSGKTDIGWLFTGLYPGQFSNIEVSTLPFLYPSAGIGSRVTWQLLSRYSGLQTDFKGVKALAVWITDPYFIAAKSHFYKNVDDFTGQKVRAAIGPPSEFVKALGASPVVVVRNEVNQKFSDGSIDAALLPAEAYLAFKTYQVAPYITWVSTVATVNAVVMNLDRWNSLPGTIQDQIMNAAGETGSALFGMQVFDKLRDDLRSLVKKSDGTILEYTLSREQLQKWIDISGQPVWNTWVKTQKASGLADAQKILDEALALSRKYDQFKDKP